MVKRCRRRPTGPSSTAFAAPCPSSPSPEPCRWRWHCSPRRTACRCFAAGHLDRKSPVTARDQGHLSADWYLSNDIQWTYKSRVPIHQDAQTLAFPHHANVPRERQPPRRTRGCVAGWLPAANEHRSPPTPRPPGPVPQRPGQHRDPTGRPPPVKNDSTNLCLAPGSLAQGAIAERLLAGAAGDERFKDLAAGVGEIKRRPAEQFSGAVTVAPGLQGQQHRRQAPPSVGENILDGRGTFLVPPAPEDALFLQPSQACGEHLARRAVLRWMSWNRRTPRAASRAASRLYRSATTSRAAAMEQARGTGVVHSDARRFVFQTLEYRRPSGFAFQTYKMRRVSNYERGIDLLFLCPCGGWGLWRSGARAAREELLRHEGPKDVSGRGVVGDNGTRPVEVW